MGVHKTHPDHRFTEQVHIACCSCVIWHLNIFPKPGLHQAIYCIFYSTWKAVVTILNYWHGYFPTRLECIDLEHPWEQIFFWVFGGVLLLWCDLFGKKLQGVHFLKILPMLVPFSLPQSPPPRLPLSYVQLKGTEGCFFKKNQKLQDHYRIYWCHVHSSFLKKEIAPSPFCDGDIFLKQKRSRNFIYLC